MKTVSFNLLRNAVILFSLCFCSCKTELNNYVNSSDGVEIKFDVQGNGDPSLIFVHGWANNRSIWDAQLAHFSEKYKVITIDLPGFGQSGNNRKKWTIQAFGEDIISVMDHLELKNVVLVGFSLGAPVVIEAAKRAPNEISGVVLVDQLHDVEVKYSPEVIHFMDSIYMDVAMNPTMDKLTPFFRRNKEESFRKIISMLENGGRPKTGWRAALNSAFKWQNDGLVSSLKVLDVPVVSINSEQPPTNVEAFRKYIPSFEAKIIPDTGHVVFWDAPEVFNGILEEYIKDFME